MNTEELSKLVAQYHENGYVLVKSLFTESDLAIYSQRFESIVRGELSVPREMKIMKDIMIVKNKVKPRSDVHAVNKIINFEDDPVLYEYVRNKALLAIVRALLDEHIYSISTNIFNKPPDVDGRHPMHQDLRYFRIRPAEGIVGVWTAISAATRENGCLSILPHSHKGELKEHSDPDWEYLNYAFYGATDVDYSARIHIEMQPGDTLLFHPLLIHGSGRNKSENFRRAISAHYASSKCESSVRDWKTGKQVRHLE